MKFKKYLPAFLSMLAFASMSMFTSCAEDDLDTNPYNKNGVSIVSYGPCPLTRGEMMKITGTKLNDVQKVLFPKGNMLGKEIKEFEEAEFSKVSNLELSVKIPDYIVPGAIRLVINSGDTVVSRGSTSFVEKIRVDKIEPKTGIRAGDVVTISGDFCWNIAQVTFASATGGVTVLAEDFLLNTREQVQLSVPAEAVSGQVTYNNGEENAIDIKIDDVEIKTAIIAENLTPEADFGQKVTLRGEDFDLVTNVSVPFFESVDFEVSADNTELSFLMPATTVEGEIVLTTTNGQTITDAIAPKMVKVTEISDNAKDLRVGDVVTIKGENFERVVEVSISDVSLDTIQHNLSGNTFTFTVPECFKGGKVFFKQHENYTAESTMMKMHSDAPEYSIWEGTCSVGNWDGSMSDLSWGGYDWNDVQVGQVLSVYLTPRIDEGGYSQVRFGNGSWSALPSSIAWGNDGNLSLSADDNVVRLTLTEDDLYELRNNGGLVICGAWFTVTKVTLSALETVLWEGAEDMGSWSNQAYYGTETMFSDAGAAVGNTVNIYYTPTADWWQFQLFDGHWGALEIDELGGGQTVNPDTYAFADTNCFSFVLTEALLSQLTAIQGWGGALLTQGENCIITKITLK